MQDIMEKITKYTGLLKLSPAEVLRCFRECAKISECIREFREGRTRDRY